MKSTPSSVPSESVLSFLVRLLGRSVFPDILFRDLAAELTLTGRMSVSSPAIAGRSIDIGYPRYSIGFVDVKDGYLCKIRAKNIDASEGEYVDTCDLQNVRSAYRSVKQNPVTRCLLAQESRAEAHEQTGHQQQMRRTFSFQQEQLSR